MYLRNKTLCVLDSSCVHHQEFFTVHTAMVYVIQVWWQLASRIRMELVPSWSCSQAVWHMPLLCVQWKTPGDGQRNSPKHVEFYSKNKFEELVHLVGFIIRSYHNARSPERQNEMSSHYIMTLTVTHLFHRSIIICQHSPWTHWCALPLTGMTLSIQIALSKDHGTSVHSFTAQTKHSGMQFGLLNQCSGCQGCRSIEGVAVLGDNHIANMYLWMFYNILCTLWIHCVATAAEQCVSSAVQ